MTSPLLLLATINQWRLIEVLLFDRTEPAEEPLTTEEEARYLQLQII